METIEMQGSEFMEKFGPSLARHASDILKPLHIPGNHSKYKEKLPMLIRKPLNAQVEAIQAIAKAIYDENIKTVFVIGEQGVGKTLLACGSSAMSDRPMRILVVCPPHMVKKWIKEVYATVPGAIAYNLNGKDCLSVLVSINNSAKPKTHEFYIMGRERAKGHYEIRPAWFKKVNRVGGYWVACPKCGQAQIQYKNDGSSKYLGEEDILRPAKCIAPKRKRGSKELLLDDKGKTIPCGEPLYCALEPGKIFKYSYKIDKKEIKGAMRGLRRYSPAEYIKKHLKGYFDLFIPDEVHEYKGESEQGAAFGKLVSACKKTLCLTGTLTGGYATDIFYLFYRTMPGLVKEDGFKFNDKAAWSERYGTVEKKTKTDQTTNKTKTTTRCKPGISPLIFSKFLMERAIFIKLADVAEGLPPYTEEVRLVKMRPDQHDEYKKMEKDFKAALTIKGKVTGKGSLKDKAAFNLLSKYVHAALSWPDRSHEAETLAKREVNSKGVEEKKEVARAKALEGIFPKESELLDIVKEERKNNRRVLVYCTYTGARDATARLKRLLDGDGWRSEILRVATVKAEERSSWIEKRVKEDDVDVLITNPELVKTGLDLLDFPTVVFYQEGYNVYTLRQASRRSWRIGQSEPVKVIYLAYQDTLQEKALTLIASKIETALIAEGDISDSAIYAVSESPDSIIRDLAKSIANGSIEGMESATQAWGRVRKQEIRANFSLMPADYVPPAVAANQEKVEDAVVAGCKEIKVDVFQTDKPKKKKVVRLTVRSIGELAEINAHAQLAMF